MLDHLLVGQAVMNAMRFMLVMLLVSVAMSVAGWLGIGAAWYLGPASRPYRAIRIISKLMLGLGVATMLLFLGLCLYGYMGGMRKHYEWSVDLSVDPLLAPFEREKCGEWKIGEKAYVNCIFEGDISLHAKFSGNREFRDKGYALWATGHQGRLTSLHFFSSPLTMSELKVRAQPLFAQWGMPSGGSDEIGSERLAMQDFRARYFSPPENGREYPWLELSIRRLDEPRAGERPWVMSMKWHWQDE